MPSEKYKEMISWFLWDLEREGQEMREMMQALLVEDDFAAERKFRELREALHQYAQYRCPGKGTSLCGVPKTWYEDYCEECAGKEGIE